VTVPILPMIAPQLLNTEKLTALATEVAGLSGTSLVVLDSHGHALASSAAASGQPPDYKLTDNPEQPPDRIPITVKDEVIGWVVARSNNGHGKNHRENAAKLLSGIIADETCGEMEMNSLSTELLEKYEEINLLYDFGESLGTVLNAQDICRIVLERGTELVSAAKALIMAADDNGTDMYVAASRGVEPKELEQGDSICRAVCRLVLREGKSQLLESAGQLTRDLNGEEDLSICNRWYPFPLLCVPLNAKGKQLGVLIIWNKPSAEIFTAGDLKLLNAVASQAAISLYNSQLIEELKKSERVKRDMEIAERIQMSLLPSKPPDIAGLDLAGKCVPALNVGGDYFDYLPVSKDELAIVIADVSGHNIVATLGIAATRGVLRSEIMRNRSAGGVLTRTNRVIYEDLSAAELFISTFYAVFNRRTGVLTYANGGHNPPFIYHADKGRCATINADGMLLGVLNEVEFEERRIKINPGDILVLYTDGITEATDRNRKQFGEARLQRIIKKNHTLSGQQILDEVFRQVYNHSAGMTQRDDITMIIMKVTDKISGQRRTRVN